jgi:magnesium chelatase family protein
VAATNPCPCGWAGDPDHPCRCGTAQRLRYWGRLAGPLLDRIDLQVVMRRPCASQLRPGLERPRGAEETSAVVAERVAAARQRMLQRNLDGLSNGQLSGHQLGQCGRISSAALDLWQQAVDQRGLSARAAERLLRVARTIADLEASLEVEASALAEALSYRSFDQPPQGL